MKIYRGLPAQPEHGPTALTIGNFDGVHKGHQAVLAHAKKAAYAHRLPLSVMTFEPHPREFFQSQPGPTRINLLRDKLTLLALEGVQQIFIMQFNQVFANLTPAHFINDILAKGLNTRWLMVGDDFRYGAKRAGDYASLEAAGQQGQFTVSKTPSIIDENGERISSSNVRKALQAGDLKRAFDLLGKPYFISGHVTHGNKLGREIGFPTLNIPIPYSRFAISGIFIVQVYGLTEQPLAGVASIGIRPTVDHSQRILLEVHLLQWQSQIYGKLIHVEFLKKLRDERKFESLDELTAAIADDVTQSKAWFANHGIQAQPAMQAITHYSASPLDR